MDDNLIEIYKNHLKDAHNCIKKLQNENAGLLIKINNLEKELKKRGE